MSVIRSREELIVALTEAAEVEHLVLLQYLFAAYSIKRLPAECPDPERQEDSRRWTKTLSLIARQEMAHLGSVCNLLSAVGAPPRLGRPNFPQPIRDSSGQPITAPWRLEMTDRLGDTYPFDFALRGFRDESLYWFVRLGLPEGVPLPDPPR